MTTNIWLGTSLANTKVVQVSAGPNVTTLVPPPTFQIGLGTALFTFTGWSPDDIVAAWAASSNVLISEITASKSGASVVFTANNAGEDFEITCTLSNAVINTSSTYQTLTFGPAPSGGTFTLTVSGLTTGNINYNATGATFASNMQTAIAALSGFGASDVLVTYVGPYFLFDFSQGRFAGTSVAAITATNANLTGGDASVLTTVNNAGNAGTSEIVTLSFPASGTHTGNQDSIQTLSTVTNAGTFTITISGYGTSTALPYTCGRSGLLAALEGLVGVGNVLVTGGPLYYPPDTTYRTLTIEFIGALAGVAVPTMSISATNSSVNEVQQLAITGNPSSGTFTITFSAQTTSALSWNASASAIQAALLALSSIGAGNVACSGGPLTGSTPLAGLYVATGGVNASPTSIDPSQPLLTVAVSYNVALIQIPVPNNVTAAILNIVFQNSSNPTSIATVTIDLVNADTPTMPTTGAQYSALSYTSTTTLTVPANTSQGTVLTATITSLIAAVQGRSGYTGGPMIVRLSSASITFVRFTGVVGGLSPYLNVNYTGGGAPVQVNFIGALGAANQPQMTTTTLTGGIVVTPSTLVNGASGAYTVTSVQTGGSATIQNISGGTFSLQINSTIVGPIVYNASAATIVTAINTAFGATVCSATGGPCPGTPVVITFINTMANMPVTVSVLTALVTNLAGGVTASAVLGVAAATGTNVFDLVVCPGEGTLGINSDTVGHFAYIILQISNTLPFLATTNTERSLGEVYLPLFGLNALKVQSAINEFFAADVCRVVKVGHSQEWGNVQAPAIVGTYGTVPPTYTSFWYMRDTYRITFVNQLSTPGTVSIVAGWPLTGSGVAADPTVFMQGTGSTILGPEGGDTLDLYAEIDRVVTGFILAVQSSAPLHQVSCLPSSVVTKSKISWRVKLLSQYAQGTLVHTGTAEPIIEGTVAFSWNKNTITDALTVTSTVLASSDAVPWNASASTIQSTLNRMAISLFGVGNVVVEGSLVNSWKSETLLDAPSNPYNELTITLTGSVAGVPFDAEGYDLSCSVVGQFNPATTFQKNFNVFCGYASKTLPPYTNTRTKVALNTPASVASLTLGVGNLTVVIPTPATLTATQIQAYLDSLFTLPAQTLYPERLRHPIYVYGTTFSEGPMDFEFFSNGYQQNAGVSLVIGTTPIGVILATVVVTQQGVLAADAVQTITLTGSPYSGTFHLIWSGNTSGSIAYNANNAAVLSALAAASPSAIVATSVTGSSTTAIVFNWAAAGGPRAAITSTSALNNVAETIAIKNIGGQGSTFVITEVTKGHGPSYADDSINWSLGHTPRTGETIVFDDSPSPMLYGLNMSSTFEVSTIGIPSTFILGRSRQVFDNGQTVIFRSTGSDPTGLTPGTTYTVVNAHADGTFQLDAGSGPLAVTTVGSGTLVVGNLVVQVNNQFGGAEIGLPHLHTTVLEYLDCYWTAEFTSITIGLGLGNGLSLGRFNSLTAATVIVIQNTGSSGLAPVPAVLFLCNNSSASLTMANGDIGVAYYSEETSVLGIVTASAGNLTINNATVTKILKGANASFHSIGTTATQPIEML